jgi:type VI secretion system secreted protein Hcp
VYAGKILARCAVCSILARNLVEVFGMRKKALWGLVVAALVLAPAVVGLLVLGGDDDGSSSARRAGALVAAGGATAYQLQLTPQSGMASPVAAKDAIEIDSFSFGVENPTTIGSATGGAGAGKAKFNALRISKKVDRASPLLFKNLAAGAHYKTAVLSLRKAGGKEPYVTYHMETVFTTNVDHGGGSPEAPTEEITFVFGKLVIKSAEDAAPPVQAGWNQVTNKSDDVITP